MYKGPGFSVYLSTFEKQWPTLQQLAGTGAPVFLSLHMGEDAGLCHQAQQVCHTLADQGFHVIADVSAETLRMFGETDLIRLAIRLKLSALRIDYGFTTAEIDAMAEKMPIYLNASTIDGEDAEILGSRGKQVLCLHNFYPRPETGLDGDYLKTTTQRLHRAGLQVGAFVPGDVSLRGPIYQGLPTLEAHRAALPSAAFADLILHYGMERIFVGDPGISEKEVQRMVLFAREGILCVPAELSEEWSHLYDRVFTCRVDSPCRLVRFQESRTYACQGQILKPDNCVERTRGSITVDNQGYARYSGEIQMIRQDLPRDPRVNVIGRVPANAFLLMDCIHGNQKFKLVKP